ncbi:MAG: hypothetical protein FWE57_03055 [Chitinispirillia bacterium]|nr:hypothetical protein [Chitinispirillia bacterium]
MKENRVLRLKFFAAICGILAAVAASFSCGPRIRESVEEVWPNGNPKKVIVYSCGKKFCNLLRTTYYFEDGQMQSDTFYDNGVPDGVMTVYNPDGSIYRQTTFEKGKQISEVPIGETAIQ